MDPFESDTLAQEAFIRATLEAESKYPQGMGAEWVGATTQPHSWCPKMTPLGRPSGDHATTRVQVQGLEVGHRHSKKKQHSIGIATSTPMLYFGYDVLIGRVSNLRKRVLVGM